MNGNPINTPRSIPALPMRSLLVPGVIVLVWCVSALVIYQPFASYPFDILDFPEFLPFLRQADGIGARMSAITEYFASRGRSSIATYALLVLNYQFWGENPLGWHITRSFEFAVAGLLMYGLLRRWNASQLGAAAGALLVVCARSAAPNWPRLVASEPVSLIVLLSAFLLATGYRDVERPWPRVAALSVAVVLLVFLKEIFVVLLPAIWAVALLTDRQGRWRWQRPGRSQRLLWVTTGVTAFASLLPAILVAANAPRDSYASLYGEGQFTLGAIVARYLSTAIPFVTVAAEFNVGILIADGTFLFLLAFGWRLLADAPDVRWNHRFLLAFACVLPLLGVLSYLPWPSFQDFYGLPFLVGTAVLVAFAVTGFEQLGRVGAIAALLLLLVPYAFMMTSSQYVAGRSRSAIALAHAATRALSEGNLADTVVIAVRGVPIRAWFGLGATLERQSVLNRQSFPPYVEAPCDAARKVLADRARGARVLVFHSHCASPSANIGSRVAIVERFGWFDWGRFRIVQDSSSADLFSVSQSATPH
jgi:hypothetical protein